MDQNTLADSFCISNPLAKLSPACSNLSVSRFLILTLFTSFSKSSKAEFTSSIDFSLSSKALSILNCLAAFVALINAWPKAKAALATVPAIPPKFFKASVGNKSTIAPVAICPAPNAVLPPDTAAPNAASLAVVASPIDVANVPNAAIAKPDLLARSPSLLPKSPGPLAPIDLALSSTAFLRNLTSCSASFDASWSDEPCADRCLFLWLTYLASISLRVLRSLLAPAIYSLIDAASASPDRIKLLSAPPSFVRKDLDALSASWPLFNLPLNFSRSPPLDPSNAWETLSTFLPWFCRDFILASIASVFAPIASALILSASNAPIAAS